MNSTNNHISEQKYIYCRNDCGARITFSDNAISKGCRKIPLQENGLPHNCPKSKFNTRRQELQERAKFVKEDENAERLAIDVPSGEHPCSNPRQERDSSNLSRKITPELQLYVDTIGPVILEILSLVQEIHEKMFPKEEEI
jgi:hypothetical protein